MMKFIKNSLLLFFVMILVNCSKNDDFDKMIINYYSECKDKSCIIDLKNYLDFEWDTMYYFSGANSLEEIERVMRIRYENYEDIGTRLIFIKNKQIVYDYDWFPNPNREKSGVVFETENDFMKINREDAQFLIKKLDQVYYLKKL